VTVVRTNPNRDPALVPSERRVEWIAGGPTTFETIPGTGGFVMLRLDAFDQPTHTTTYGLRLFVAAEMLSFAWQRPDGETWRVIDVPNGFVLNDGTLLLDALIDPGGAGGPVIVHGRP
jgi:hypothetical protein